MTTTALTIVESCARDCPPHRHPQIIVMLIKFWVGLLLSTLVACAVPSRPSVGVDHPNIRSPVHAALRILLARAMRPVLLQVATILVVWLNSASASLDVVSSIAATRSAGDEALGMIYRGLLKIYSSVEGSRPKLLKCKPVSAGAWSPALVR